MFIIIDTDWISRCKYKYHARVVPLVSQIDIWIVVIHVPYIYPCSGSILAVKLHWLDTLFAVDHIAFLEPDSCRGMVRNGNSI